MSRISRRIGAIEPSATLAITSKAKEMRAQGLPVIGFGAGDPFSDTLHPIVGAACSCTRPEEPQILCAPAWASGVPACGHRPEDGPGFRVRGDADRFVTNGGKMAVFEAFAALLDPADEVLMPSPYSVTYPTWPRGSLWSCRPISRPAFGVRVEDLERQSPIGRRSFSSSRPRTRRRRRRPSEVARSGAGAAGLGDDRRDLRKVVHGTPSSPRCRSRCPSWQIGADHRGRQDLCDDGLASWVGRRLQLKAATSNPMPPPTSPMCASSRRVAAVSGSALAGRANAFDRRRKKMIELLEGDPGVSLVEPEGAVDAFPSFEEVLGTLEEG